MKNRYFLLSLLCIGLIVGAASLAAAVTHLAGTSPDSGPVSDTIGTDAKVKVISIVYYHNAMRQTLDPTVYYHTIPANRMQNLFNFVIKAKYEGPAGTYGQIFMGDGNTATHEDFKVLPPGKVVTMKCTHAWEPSVDMTLYMVCSGPDFLSKKYYEFYLDRP